MNIKRTCPLDVYVLTDKEGVALYVGITSDVWRRIASHKDKPWHREIARVDVHPMPADADPYNFEMAFIDRLKPLHNTETRWRKHLQSENPCHFVRYCGSAATRIRTVWKAPGFTAALPVCDEHAVPAHLRYSERGAA